MRTEADETVNTEAQNKPLAIRTGWLATWDDLSPVGAMVGPVVDSGQKDIDAVLVVPWWSIYWLYLIISDYTVTVTMFYHVLWNMWCGDSNVIM